VSAEATPKNPLWRGRRYCTHIGAFATGFQIALPRKRVRYPDVAAGSFDGRDRFDGEGEASALLLEEAGEGCFSCGGLLQDGMGMGKGYGPSHHKAVSFDVFNVQGGSVRLVFAAVCGIEVLEGAVDA